MILAGLTPAAVGLFTGAREAGYAGSAGVYSKLADRGFKDADEMRKIKKTKKDEWREKEALRLKNQKELAGYKAGLEGEEADDLEFKDIMQLRKERSQLPTSKATQDIASSYNRIQTVMASKPTAAGDFAMIFNFMKMLDPGSVVRESEFRAAGAARGLPDAVQTLFDRTVTGQKLTRKQRKDFAQKAHELYGSQQEVQSNIDKRYTELAGKYKIDPSEVILPFGVDKKQDYEQRFVAKIPKSERELYLEALSSDEKDADAVIEHMRGKYGY